MRKVRGFTRTHKACVSCRKRRLKCDQGDPDEPSEGPCSRCRRERRVCRFEEASSPVEFEPERDERAGKRAAIALTTAGIDHQPTSERQRLISSSLDNPNDALRIAAETGPGMSVEDTHGPSEPPDWEAVIPVRLGFLSSDSARYLLDLYRIQLHPLYPLLHPNVLLPRSISRLINTQSLLLAATIALASTLEGGSRFSALWDWLRAQISSIVEGDEQTRRLDTVEAILILAEWPANHKSESAEDVQYITQDNARSWSYIGLATRLAQELDLQEVCMKHAQREGPLDWRQERELRTWLYCYNADRQISVRLGRSAVIQLLTSMWWEQLSALATRSSAWNRGMPLGYEFGRQQGLIAALMGTVHDRLFTDSDVTAALLRTGQWENILRNLALEIAQFSNDLAPVLAKDEPGTVLWDMEMNYLRLYGNGIALRALQERLMRIHRDGTLGYTHRSLFNLAEGPFILVAIEAASEILRLATALLSHNGILQRCPTRTFHRILYAATFLLKAMAVGVVEDGGLSIHPLLETTISALDGPSIIARGISRLLKRMLHAHHIIAQGDPTERTPDPTFLPPENLVFDRQQDEAFLDIWGKELRSDPLFAFWLNDEYA